MYVHLVFETGIKLVQVRYCLRSKDLFGKDGPKLPYLNPKKTRGMSHNGLAIYIKKYLNAKRKIMETQIFHHAKI
jgi:hypothetical protein